MRNLDAFPGISNMDGPIVTLYHRWIGVFSGSIFQHGDRVPTHAVVANRNVENTPSARRQVRMIIDQQLPTVLKRNGVRSTAGVRKRRRLELAPGSTIVVRPRLPELAIPVAIATDRLKSSVLMKENARLNRPALFLAIDRLRSQPRFIKRWNEFKVNAPTVVLCARWTEDRSVGKLDRLVLNRTNEIFRRRSPLAPGPAAVMREKKNALPFGDLARLFVEKEHGAGSRLEQNRIPTWNSLVVRVANQLRNAP